MKFSCPQCSAKYQISDDKLGGRTAKMRCRSCGKMVPIRAAPSHRSMAAAPVVSAFALAPDTARAKRVAPPTTPASLPKTEWHAGIDGVSVGPITVQELEKHVRAGKVTPETYVWREGMNGWQVLGEVTALAGLLTNSPLAAAPPSIPAIDLRGQSPSRRRISPRKARAGDGAQAVESVNRGLGINVTSSEPLIEEAVPSAGIPSLLSPPAEALTIPVPADLSKSELFNRVEDQPSEAPIPLIARKSLATDDAQGTASGKATTASGSPAVSDAPLTRDDGSASLATAVTVVPQPSAFASVTAAPETSAPETSAPAAVPVEVAPFEPHDPAGRDSLVMQFTKSRQGRWALPFTVIAAVIFGVTMGFVLFGDQQTKIVKQIVEVPAPLQEQGVSPDGTEPKEDEGNTVVVADVAIDASPSGKSSDKTPVTAPKKEEPTKVKEGLKGLSGLAGLNGPSSGPTVGSKQTGGGKPLTSSQIQRTVSTYRTSVKRGCWERALMTKDRDAPSSARVTLSISVSSNGSVSRATTGGEPKGYHGLASCISKKVKTWRFPTSSGPTTVNVPFVFAAQ